MTRDSSKAFRYFDGPAKHFVADGPPAIFAEDLNGPQGDAARLWRALRHAELCINSDFAGGNSLVDLSPWTNYQGTLTLAADADANGVIQVVTSGGPPPRGGFSTSEMYRIGTSRDLYFSCRVKIVSITGALADFGGLAQSYCFRADPSLGKWVAFSGGVPHTTAIALDSDYRELEVYRLGGVAHFRIDGKLIYRESSDFDVDGERWGTLLSDISGTGEAWLDRMRFVVLGAY